MIDLESPAVEGDESKDKAAAKAEQEDDVHPGLETSDLCRKVEERTEN